MDMVVGRFDVFLVNRAPAGDAENGKMGPGVVISPDEMNRHLQTVIIAPMATAVSAYPTRVPCRFKRKEGQIVLDQLRTVAKSSLIKKLGFIDAETQTSVLSVLQRLFAL